MFDRRVAACVTRMHACALWIAGGTRKQRAPHARAVHTRSAGACTPHPAQVAQAAQELFQREEAAV
jgi:hypothetical protein